jgi:uncharacterized membrane protein YbhN (UPF0104 family)
MSGIRPSLDGTADDLVAHGADEEMTEALSPRHLGTRLLELAALVAVVVVLIVIGPGLGSVRDRLGDASPGWLVAAVVLELLSALSYVVIFRATFCARMSWGLSYQIGMAEQAANSLLPAGGAGGLALGVWALRRRGLSAEHIGRRTVAFFLLTSVANVGTLILFAAFFATGLLSGDSSPGLTYAFAIAGLAGTAIVLALPAIAARRSGPQAPKTERGRLKAAIDASRHALTGGVKDSVWLLRHRPVGVLVGSFGYMGFDIAVLGVCFLAFGYTPDFGVLVVAYLIGQLGGLLPLPGGIGGIEGGLIGTFALYNVPISAATVAVLTYRVLALWIPAILGSVAFVQLRATLREKTESQAMCEPLADQIATVKLPAGVGG